jgi:hypothetical protein
MPALVPREPQHTSPSFVKSMQSASSSRRGGVQDRAARALARKRGKGRMSWVV